MEGEAFNYSRQGYVGPPDDLCSDIPTKPPPPKQVKWKCDENNICVEATSGDSNTYESCKEAKCAPPPTFYMCSSDGCTAAPLGTEISYNTLSTCNAKCKKTYDCSNRGISNNPYQCISVELPEKGKYSTLSQCSNDLNCKSVIPKFECYYDTISDMSYCKYSTKQTGTPVGTKEGNLKVCEQNCRNPVQYYCGY